MLRDKNSITSGERQLGVLPVFSSHPDGQICPSSSLLLHFSSVAHPFG